MSGDNTVPVDVSGLNMRIVREYGQHPTLLELITAWVWAPGAGMATALKDAKVLIDSIQPTVLPPVLYRGLSAFVRPKEMRQQDTLGLLKAVADEYRFHKRPAVVLTRPTAFTSSYDVAVGFSDPGGPGDDGWVISIPTVGLARRAIVVTDELMAAIAVHQKNRAPLRSQKEVIILPDSVKIPVMLVDKKKPGSNHW